MAGTFSDMSTTAESIRKKYVRLETPSDSIVLATTVAVGLIAFIGAVRRRWIADDALIILRTVENLRNGNGPVFNAGERVETSTSTVWQYLLWIVSVITQADPAGIAIWLSIVLGVAALVIATLASVRFQRDLNGPAALLVPFGSIIYLALPPARDFLSSGLEWSLSLFYLAVLWLILVRMDEKWTYWSAVWIGLSWLVRPEMILYGIAAGFVLLIRQKDWKRRLAVVAAGVALPLAYQVFRMGYYGLMYPHTAVAKSASESLWGRGFEYLRDFVSPYSFWVPTVIIVAIVIAQGRKYWTLPTIGMTAAAALHLLYVIRVGGDFMHARMILLPLFALLLPMMVVPVHRRVFTVAVGAAFGWGLTIALAGSIAYERWADDEVDPDLGTVYEPTVWTAAVGRDAADRLRRVEDFAPLRHLNGYSQAMENLEAGAAFGYFDEGDSTWKTIPRTESAPPTVYWLSLGYTSLNAPLDVRVLDPMGLASPLAARQPRVEGERVGHDKKLAFEWQVADSGADLDNLPDGADAEFAKRARSALDHPDFQELFASYRDPLTPQRFFKNIGFALTKARTLELEHGPEVYGF